MENFQNILGDKPMNVIVPSVLFALLAPDFLVSLPSMQRPFLPVNYMRVATHAAVFGVIYALLRKQFPQYY